MLRSDIESLRKELQNQEEPLTYWPARLGSIYITYFLATGRVKPDAVTIAWVLCLLLASAFFAADRLSWNILGGALIAVYYIFDCVDGELARYYKTSSIIGSQLEQIGHRLGHGALVIGITVGSVRRTGLEIYWIVGMAAIIGDYMFHLTYYIINLTFDRKTDYGILHKLTKYMYSIMPINTNIFLLGALTNSLHVALLAWCVLANIT